MSFTAGALLYRESVTLSELWVQTEDWGIVKDEVLTGNLLQMRTMSAAKRVFREARARLQTLTPPQMALLVDGLRQEQNCLLWLAICKRFLFIHDFAVEVLREKFLLLNPVLTQNDYDQFFANKTEWHPELEALALSTRKKQREIVFRMLREGELLSTDGVIIPPIFSPHLVQVITQDDPAYFQIYPTPDPMVTGHTQ
ncbi:MAG: DUF1819 family protein [Chloroflexota bacterium]|nr:DUF1819 family protein [Chloroflexota bacterium]